MKTRKITLSVLMSILLVVLIALVAVGFTACDKNEEEFTVTFFDGETIIKTVVGKSGDSLQAPSDPIRDGYNFDGWATSPNGEVVQLPATITKNESYYAKYSALPIVTASHTVTLDLNGGSLEKTTIQIHDGDDLYDAISGLQPEYNGDPVFAAWFLNGVEITKGSVSVTSDLTVVAKYKVQYTVEVHKETSLDSGEYTMTTVGGWGYLGEEISPAVEVESYYTYTSVAGDIIYLTLSANASENIFRVHYKIVGYNVVFRANAPEGTDVEGEMDGTVVVSGEALTPECGYSIYGYRFAGWSEIADGEVQYKRGESITVTRAIVLYAQWDRGYIDSAGGDDIVFISQAEPGVAYLQRPGLAEVGLEIEQKGTYDANSRLFVFTNPDGEEQIGRIDKSSSAQEEKYTFVWYKNEVNQVYYIYNAYDVIASLNTITLKAFNDATITYYGESGNVVSEFNGTYRLDRESGDYIFTYEDGSEVYFMLTSSPSSGKPVCLFRGVEEGMFYLYNFDLNSASGLDRTNIDRSVAIYLDGYGSVLYMNAALNYMHWGTYRYENEETGEMYLQVFINESEQDRWWVSGSFRIDEAEGTPVYIMGNTVATIYSRETSSGKETLELDGFSSATYTKADGTVIDGYYVLNTMTYAIEFYGDNGEDYQFMLGWDSDLGYYFTDVDPLCGIYWWQRGGVYYVNLVVQADGEVWIYLGADNDEWLACAYGVYEYLGNDIYHFEFIEIADSAEIIMLFGEFDFILGKFDTGLEIMPTFTLVYQQLEGKQFATSDGGQITLNRDTSLTMYKDGNNYIGSYIYYAGQIGQLVVNVNGTSYMFIELNGEFYELFDTYVNYHNNFSYTLALELLSGGNALILDYDRYTIIGQGAWWYDEATQMYTFSIGWIGDIYRSEMEDYWTFKFIVTEINGVDMMLLYDEDLVWTLPGSSGGSIRFDEYGYAYYKASELAQEIKCELFDYGDYWQLRAVETGAIYRVLNNRYQESSENWSFEALGNKQIIYVNNKGQIGPDHYILYSGGDGIYVVFNETVSGLIYSEYALTWTYDANRGVYNVKYAINSKQYDITFQVEMMGIDTSDWAQFNLAIEQTTAASQTYSFTILSADRETIVGYIYNDGFGDFYRNDIEGFEYAIQVTRNRSGDYRWLFVILLDANGNQTSTMYYFDYIDGMDNTVWLRGEEGGSGVPFNRQYRLFEYGTEFRSNYFVFDGHYLAKQYIDNELYAEGTYTATEEGYLFEYELDGVPHAKVFVIRNNNYLVTHESYYGYHVNGRWEMLDLDLYATYAYYTDRYGYVYDGVYVGLQSSETEAIIRFESYKLQAPLYFRLLRQQGTFELVTDEFVIDENNKLVVYQTNEEHITIPDGVTEIPAAFFSGNTTLKTVDLNNVTVIGEQAFYGCTALERVIGGNNITVIQANTFEGCVNLVEFDCSNLTRVGSFAFYETALKRIDLRSAVRIEDQAFTRCVNAEYVFLGENIEYIGDFAFSGYSDGGVANLYEVYLPNLTYMGFCAFANVTTLKSIYIPQITEIYEYTFRNCTSLSEFDFTNIKFIGRNAFQYCAFAEVSLPNVVTVEENAFAGPYIKSIYFGEYAELIGIKVKRDTPVINGVIYDVPAYKDERSPMLSLESITVHPDNPNYKSENNCLIDISNSSYYTVIMGCATSVIPADPKVKLIGWRAFADTAIREIVIPDNIVFIDVNSFADCDKLVKITLGAGLIEASFGGSAFEGCYNLREVYNRTIYSNETIIANKNSFGRISTYCSNLYKDAAATKFVENGEFVYDVTNPSKPVMVEYKGTQKDLVLPESYNGVQYTIGENIFAYCDMESITLPSWMTEIDEAAFLNCIYLTSITFTNSHITTIGNYAFYGCISLTSIEIPASVKVIGNYAFYGCTNLATVDFGNVEQIGTNAFEECPSITEINLPETLKIIGERAFYRCYGIRELTIPGSVEAIGSFAFAYNRSLTTLTVKEGVTALDGMYIFDSCTSLVSINLPNTLVSIGGDITEYESFYSVAISGAFEGCTSLESVVLPNSVERVGMYLFAGCTSLKNVTLSENLWCIADYMFADTAIETIVIPDSVQIIFASAFSDCGSLKTVYVGSGLEEIMYGAFAYCFNLETIYFEGSKEEWNAITIDHSYNDILVFVEYVFNYED